MGLSISRPEGSIIIPILIRNNRGKGMEKEEKDKISI